MKCTASEAIEEARTGRMLVILDESERENEADLFIPADAAEPEHIRTMIRHGGGLVCVAVTQEHAERLHLPLMVPLHENTEKTGVNFTIGVDAREGITSGVSAHDRTRTIRVLADASSNRHDLVRPGHVFGLVARAEGILERQGHTEAAVDLARLAGRAPSGVLCEIIGQSGHMAGSDEIAQLARMLGVKIVSIDDLFRHVRSYPHA